MNLVSMGAVVLIGYIAVLVLYSILTYIQYNVNITKPKSVKNYYGELTRLEKMYNREEKEICRTRDVRRI